MSIRNRVERLEADFLGQDGACVCAERLVMRVRYGDEPEDTSPAPLCAKCGGTKEVRQFHVVYADEVAA